LTENSASGSTDKTHRHWQHGFLPSLQTQLNQRRRPHLKSAVASTISRPPFPPPSSPSVLSSLEPVKPLEVERLIQKLPMKTLPLAIIPIRLLKQCQVEFSVCLPGKCFFSHRIVSRIDEVCYRYSSTIKKTGLDTSVMKNFRPVSPVHTIKLLERLAVVRLKPHICSSSNWNTLQSAYSQGHSTETALCKILDDIIGAVDIGYITALVSLDISAAFDVIDLGILIQRVEEEFGITDTCLKLDHVLPDRTFSYSSCRLIVIIYCWRSSRRTRRIDPWATFVYRVRCSDRKTDPQPRRHLSPVC